MKTGQVEPLVIQASMSGWVSVCQGTLERTMPKRSTGKGCARWAQPQHPTQVRVQSPKMGKEETHLQTSAGQAAEHG